MTSFGEIVMPSCRYFDDEDEDALEDLQVREFNLSTELGGEKKILVVAEGPLPTAYIQLCTADKEVATIHAKHNNQESNIGTVYRGDDWTVVSWVGELNQSEYSPAAKLVLSLAQSETQIVCITARHISEYRGEDCGEENPLVRSLCTSSFPSNTLINRLEVPNILTGLSAALLSVASVRGMAALLLVNFVEMTSVDSLSLAGFQAIHSLQAVSGSKLSRPNNLAAALKARKPFSNPTNLYL